MDNWIVAYTSPQSERKAKERLEERGFKVFAPTRKEIKVVRRTRARTEVERFMFPRYMFVQFGPGCTFPMLRAADGIVGVICNNGAPCIIPGAVIDKLIDKCAQRMFDEQTPPPPSFRPGEQARITDGPLAGFLAIVEEMLPGQSARIAVEMFGRANVTTMAVDRLERVA